MVRPTKTKLASAPDPTPSQLDDSSERLTWPMRTQDFSPKPRLFYAVRQGAYEWQAYVMSPVDNIVKPIGKPDLIDIICQRINAVMRYEGNQDFAEEQKRLGQKV